MWDNVFSDDNKFNILSLGIWNSIIGSQGRISRLKAIKITNLQILNQIIKYNAYIKNEYESRAVLYSLTYDMKRENNSKTYICSSGVLIYV